MTPFESRVMISTDKANNNISIAEEKIDLAGSLLYERKTEDILDTIDFLLESIVNISVAIASLRDIVEDEEFKDE